MPAQDIIFRLTKGSPLTAAEMDENLRKLRDFINSLEALFLTAFNSNGGLKNNTVGTDQIIDRTITNDDLGFLFNFYAVDTGVPDALTISFTPALNTYSAGLVFFVRANNTNTGPSTLNVNGVGAVPIKKNSTAALIAGDILDDAIYILVHDGTNFQLLNPSSSGGGGGGGSGGPAGRTVITATGAGNFVVPANVFGIDVEVVGGGGGGGRGIGGPTAGDGGGGGGYARKMYSVTPAQSIPYTIGAGGVGSNGDGSDGADTVFDVGTTDLTGDGGHKGVTGGGASDSAGGAFSGGDVGENGSDGGTPGNGGKSGYPLSVGGTKDSGGIDTRTPTYGGGGAGMPVNGFPGQDGADGLIIVSWQ